MNVPITNHANKRMQQRSIPKAVVEWLLDFGARERSGASEIVYFDKKSKKELSRELGPQIVKSIARFLDVYAVISDDGYLVTTGYRYKRICEKY